MTEPATPHRPPQAMQDSPRPQRSQDKTAARIGVAAGATLLIVGLTGTSWLKHRPESSEDPPKETVEVPVPAMPTLIARYPELTGPAPKPEDGMKPSRVNFGFLRMQFDLAIRRLRGDPELVKMDEYLTKHSPDAKRALAKAQLPPDWPKGFNPTLYAFKALAYATIIVVGTFSSALYATCWYYDAWNPELLVHDIRNTMTARMSGIRPFVDRYMPEGLRTVKQADRDRAAAAAAASEPTTLPEWAVRADDTGDEETLFTAAWWDRVTEATRLAEQKKQERLAILIEERNERARQRQRRKAGHVEAP